MTTHDAFIAFLPVRDLEATHAFYHDVLQAPLLVDQGSCRIYQIAAGGCIGFCQRDGFDVAATSGVIATIVTEDVERVYRQLVEHDVETDGPPRHNPTYRIFHFYARDPDGWAVEVQRFDDPGWSEPLVERRGRDALSDRGPKRRSRSSDHLR